MARTTPSLRSSRTSATTTTAPDRASTRQIASPSPRPPPVTSATLPSRSATVLTSNSSQEPCRSHRPPSVSARFSDSPAAGLGPRCQSGRRPHSPDSPGTRRALRHKGSLLISRRRARCRGRWPGAQPDGRTRGHARDSEASRQGGRPDRPGRQVEPDSRSGRRQPYS